MTTEEDSSIHFTIRVNMDGQNHALEHLRGGLAVGRWTCDLQVAGSIPSRSAFT